MTDTTPAHLGGDVPVEKWRQDLDAILATAIAERPEAISGLLEELDEHVSSL